MFKNLYGFLSATYKTFHNKEWNVWMFWADVNQDFAYIMRWKLADVLKEEFNVR